MVTQKTLDVNTNHTQWLKDALKVNGNPGVKILEDIFLTNELSISEIENDLRSGIEKILAKGATEWYVNLTGGNKLMSIAAYDTFSNGEFGNVDYLYIDIGKPDVILFENDQKDVFCDYPLNINEYLAGYGEEIDNWSVVTGKKNNFPKLENLALATAKVSGDLWSFLVKNDRKEIIRKGTEVRPGEIKVNKDLFTNDMATLLGLNLENEWLVGTTSPKTGDFLTGGWLEAFMFNWVVKHQTFNGITQVLPGCHLHKKNQELDVCFIKNQTLYGIECKSGFQMFDKKADFLFKIFSIVTNIKALKTKIWGITTSVYLQNNEGAKKAAFDRAKVYGINLILRGDIQTIADNYDDQELFRKYL